MSLKYFLYRSLLGLAGMELTFLIAAHPLGEGTEWAAG